MDQADAATAWALALLRWSGAPRLPSMPCAAPRGIAPMSVRSVLPLPRGQAYPRWRRAAAGPHEFAAADERGPTWRAAPSRGVVPPRSSADPPTAAHRVSPGGDNASEPAPHHASSRPIERRLKEIHEQPHRGIQSRQRRRGFQALEAAIADRAAHDRAILLLHPSLVVLAIGTAARELDPHLLAIIPNGLVLEHAVMVGVQPEQG